MPSPIVIHQHVTSTVVVEELAGWIVEQANEAIAQRGYFRWALSGGGTPQQLYSLMSQDTWQRKLPWNRTALFFGDERDVPPTHLQSNYRMVNHALLSSLHTPVWVIGRWHTEASPGEALALMENQLQKYLPRVPGQAPQFDVVLLGLGTEGHTASLFPESPVLASERWVEHVFVPSQDMWRYTLTLNTINQARHCAFLVTGSSKAEIVRDIMSRQSPNLPASLVEPRDGQVHWFIDDASAALLEARP